MITHISALSATYKQKKKEKRFSITNELGYYSNSTTGRGLLISCFLMQVYAWFVVECIMTLHRWAPESRCVCIRK